MTVLFTRSNSVYVEDEDLPQVDDDIQFIREVFAIGEDFEDGYGADDDINDIEIPTPPASPSQETIIPTCYLHGVSLQAGDCVELIPEGNFNFGDFILVKFIVQKRNHEIVLRGIKLKRSTRLPCAHRHLNEITMMYFTSDGDSRPSTDQSLVDTALSTVQIGPSGPRKRQIVFTSAPWPSFNPESTESLSPQLKEYYKHNGKLYCRTVFEARYPKERTTRTKATAGSVRYIRPSECEAKYRKGSSQPRYAVINMEEARKHRTRFLYGSGCAGGGGDCTGARLAGAKVVVAWDIDETAAQTLKKNHPDVEIFNMDQFEVLQHLQGYRFDILHLSWPCQFFSPIHTRPGPNDDHNSAILFATERHLEVCKPLYMTMENTFGLLYHAEYFLQLIADIVSQGYNVSWKVCQFMEYGSPAKRRRLIILASKRGLPMPPFPKPTNGPPGSGLRPFVTMLDACGDIPEDATLHLRMGYKVYNPPKPQYDPRIQAPCVLTLDGIPHWSGERNLTPRERSRLQKFPLTYEFEGNKTQVLKQIGNAVPPGVWKHFVKSIMDSHLQWQNGMNDEDDWDVILSSDHDESSESVFIDLT